MIINIKRFNSGYSRGLQYFLTIIRKYKSENGEIWYLDGMIGI